MTDEPVPAPVPRLRRILWACTLAVTIFVSFTAGYMVALWPAPASPKPPPEAKPAKPPDPAPGGKVAWGEAVNGLQVGLTVLGHGDANIGWNLQDFVCSGRECVRKRMVEQKMIVPLGTCPECGKGARGTGQVCAVCAFRLRVCRMCRKSFRFGTRFREDEPIVLMIHLRNTGDKAVEILQPGSSFNWGFRLVFVPKNGGVPRTGNPVGLPEDPALPAPVTIAPNGTRSVTSRITPGAWLFHDAREKPSVPYVKALPPGVYTVTATYEHAAGHEQREVCPYWHGKVSTAPVEIEIKPKRKPEKQSP